jgi:hypothetical protein
MKKLVRIGALLSILALILMLTIGSAGAQPLTQDGDPGIPGEVRPRVLTLNFLMTLPAKVYMSFKK